MLPRHAGSADAGGLIGCALPYTMTQPGPDLATSSTRSPTCVRTDVPGAFVECGVWKGGSMLAMILDAPGLGVDDRDIYLYDTFEGMTEPSDADTSTFDEPAPTTWSRAQADGRRAWAGSSPRGASTRAPVPRPAARRPATRRSASTSCAGKVEDTLPEHAPDELAVLRLDTDWYESTAARARPPVPAAVTRRGPPHRRLRALGGLPAGGRRVLRNGGAAAPARPHRLHRPHGRQVLMRMRVLTLRTGTRRTTTAATSCRATTSCRRFVERGPRRHGAVQRPASSRRRDRRASRPRAARPARARAVHRDGVLLRPSLRARLGVERRNHAALRRALDDVRPDVVSVWHMGAMSRRPAHHPRSHGHPDRATRLRRLADLRADAVTGGWRRSTASAPAAPGAGAAPPPACRRPLPDIGGTGAFCFVSELHPARAARPWRRGGSRARRSCTAASTTALPAPRAVPRPAVAVAAAVRAGASTPARASRRLVRALALLPPEATLEVARPRLAPTSGAARAARRRARPRRPRPLRDARPRTSSPTATRRADVFVFPSEWDEPFGLVPVEAMACGTPVVATGVGGSGEFLVDGAQLRALRTRATRRRSPPPSAASHDDAELRARSWPAAPGRPPRSTSTALAECFEGWHVAAAGGSEVAAARPRPAVLAPAVACRSPSAEARLASPTVTEFGGPIELKEIPVARNPYFLSGAALASG